MLGITINYDSQRDKFLIKCSGEHNNLVMGLPDRRFRKTSRLWAAPALRRNIEYMRQHLSNPQMYSPEALKAFNQRSKELSPKPRLAGRSGEVFPSWLEFKNEPLKHQMDALLKYYPMDEIALLFEQGLGKTFAAINLAAAWRMTSKIDSVVVICPSSIKLVWGSELIEHCPIDFQDHTIKSGRYKATERFSSEKTDFQWLVAGVEALSQGNAHKYIRQFMQNRRCLMIVDESSTIKTPNKTRTDKCIELGQLAVKRMILSGTAITQGLEDFYSQFYFLNPDIIGYSSFVSYRARYCRTIPIEVKQDVFIQKIVGYKREDELLSLVKPYTTRVEKKDALDLPEKIYQTRFITMNPDQKKMYAEMKYELFTEVNGIEYEVTSFLEQMLRLQQITGGHYPHDDGTKVIPKPIPGANPKIKELLNCLDETSGKVVIWCRFRAEIEAVAIALQSKNIEFVEFHGGCDDDDKKAAVKSFNECPNTKVFLATRAAAYGLTLVSASTAIYYSLGYSLEEYEQSQDRIHRIGQTESCNYIHLICDKTIDVDVLKALKEKKTVAELIYDIIKNQ